tara:strand:+ start:10633 stop:11079 length:447 start_codon:yes stop_codon:yes gene_type:complete
MKVRKNYLILPSFQLKVLLGAGVPFFISVFLIYYKVFDALDRMQGYLKASGQSGNNNIYNLFMMQENIIQKSILTSMGVGLLLMSVSLIYLSHKLAGPMYKIKVHLKNNKNNFEPIRFRKTDNLGDLETDMNFYISKAKDNSSNKKAS